MGREVRRVPANWSHPYDFGRGCFRPLLDGGGLAHRTAEWDKDAAAWARGEFPDYADDESRMGTYAAWAGDRPDPADYMPAWTEAEATHYQMYEDTSEGTPISPVMASPEELARWLADTGASSFGRLTATYEQWLRVCRGGFAPSLMLVGGTLQSGVAALEEK